MRDGFASFVLLFEQDVRVPETKRTSVTYLHLLNLPDFCWDDALLTLRAVRYGLRRSPDVEAEVTAMLHCHASANRVASPPCWRNVRRAWGK